MHAVLITAYTDMAQLTRLVCRLDSDFFRVLVHLDRSGTLGEKEQATLENMGCVVLRKRSIQWGSYSNLLANVDLMRLAAVQSDVEYVHIISGQDYPIATPDRFRTLCDGRVFMGCKATESPGQDKARLYARRDFFHYLWGPAATMGLYRWLNDWSLAIQKRIGMRRQTIKPFGGAFTGLIYASCPIAVIRWLLQEPDVQVYLKSLRSVRLPEEFFLQNIVMNSPFQDRVVRSNLRYIEWERGKDGRPPFLEANSVGPALACGGLFARKVSTSLSADFLDAIDAQVFE